MNINSEGVWPEKLDESLITPSEHAIARLLGMRTETYMGFAQIEQHKGLLKPIMSLTSTHGQEAVRILIQRGLEEMAEAVESKEDAHYLEELIDSINYFWSIAILDPNAPLDKIVRDLSVAAEDVEYYGHQARLDLIDLGGCVLKLNGLCEKLRHRAWMNHAQSQYFDGWAQISYVLSWHFNLILESFEDWQDFVRFYIAKDRVLKFRIKSKY